MKKCPVCSSEMTSDRVICHECWSKTVQDEPGRKQRRLALQGQNLMLVFAIFLFVKGCWMGLSEASYSQFVNSLGFPQKSAVVHYIGSAFSTISAVLYISAWIAGFIGLNWRTGACVAALAVFGVGQIIVQVAGLQPKDSLFKAIALVVIWLALPIYQFLALFLGGEPYSRIAAGDPESAKEC